MYPVSSRVSNGGSTKINVDFQQVKKAALVLRAINHKLRQKILMLIEEHEQISVTDIYIKLRLEQPVASQHLAILRKAGFVKTERDGKFIYYKVNYKRIEELTTFVNKLLH